MRVAVSTKWLFRIAFISLSNAACSLLNLAVIDVSIEFYLVSVGFNLVSKLCLKILSFEFNSVTVIMVEEE